MSDIINVITAQESTTKSIVRYPVYVFLAGGISGCRNWQVEVIEKMEELVPIYPILKRTVLINPRHPQFDTNDRSMAIEQIRWEHRWLQKADIVSYFFDNSESLHPITLYELGKWANKKTSVITICNGYKRQNDVYIQTALDGLYCGIYDPEQAVEQHARSIAHTAALLKGGAI